VSEREREGESVCVIERERTVYHRLG